MRAAEELKQMSLFVETGSCMPRFSYSGPGATSVRYTNSLTALQYSLVHLTGDYPLFRSCGVEQWLGLVCTDMSLSLDARCRKNCTSLRLCSWRPRKPTTAYA